MRDSLDLNNLPNDFIKDHNKQPLDDHSSSAASGIHIKKKNNAKDERGKVYECRFCSLKFRKSQALGGHMNRHRQERETETLNQARQLVFGSDNIINPTSRQLGQEAVHGGYHYTAGFNMGGNVYPTRLFSGSSATILPPHPLPSPPRPPQPHQHAYTSLPSRFSNTYLSQYSNSQLINDCSVDRHV